MLDESVIRTLAEWGRGPVVTSLYLDVDGARYPRPSDVAVRVDHLLRLASQRAEPMAADERAAVDDDLARIREWLIGDFDRGSTRGVAIFSSTARGLFETVRLPVSVRDHISLGAEPDLAQLCSALASTETALVIAVDTERSRLFRVRSGEVEELEAPSDELPHRIDIDIELGSYERRHEELARQHYRRVAQAAADETERRPVDHLVLNGPAAAVAAVESHLPSRLGGLVVGRLGLPMSSDPHRIAQAATEALEAAGDRHRAALLEELRERASTGTGAVTGLDATLDALGAGLVRSLVVEDGFEHGGGRCPSCGLLVARDGSCQRCGVAVDEVDDVVAAAMTDAFLHHVELGVIGDGDISALGHIGALKRW